MAFCLLAWSLALASEPPDEAALWEQRLQAWFEASYAPSVRAAWRGAAPTAAYRQAESVRWGPDALVHPRTCPLYNQDLQMTDPAEWGMTPAEIEAARARLGPGWETLPTGFDAWAVMGSFRRHPDRVGASSHFEVWVTRLPEGLSGERLFDAGIAQGCSLTKYSEAYLWSGDKLVRLTGPCSESSRFAGWTLLVHDALPGWSGAPSPERFPYAPCGTMGIHLADRATLEAAARR